MTPQHVVIFETGTDPAPKKRYRVEVLTRAGVWRETHDIPLKDIAIVTAKYAAREQRTRARVIDTDAAGDPVHTNGSQ